MSKYSLVIVESPAKAKTINNYLGSDFKVVSCGGHIRDLAKGQKRNDIGIDIDNNFQPNYQVSPGKSKIVSELKTLAKAAQEIILASDEDREGEAIAWHLCQVLKLDESTTKRIVFHEITKSAIQRALDNPRFINQNLVDAQQSRRILDRIVGFELSPVLWKKLNNYKLSAGRVQSVAVRLILEKEDLIQSFKPEPFFETVASFKTDDRQIKAKLNQIFNDFDSAKQFLGLCQQTILEVLDLKVKLGSQKPSPPFKTSSLQQVASSKLGYSPKRTMALAQELYEAGQITYHRTDSLNLSRQFQKSVETYVVDQFGQEYSSPRNYQTSKLDAQEAHEAIRPTSVNTVSPKIESKNLKPAQNLYRLIYQRAVASQMAPAQTELTTVSVGNKDLPHQFLIKGKTLKFHGFLKVDQSQIAKDSILPKLEIGQRLLPVEIVAEEKLTKPPARYTEASLIGKLEDLGIGRPSTYAPIINTVVNRGYVEKGSLEPEMRSTRNLILQNGEIKSQDSQVATGGAVDKLLPTDLARLINKFLIKYFELILDYDFTNKIETQLDQIADGQLGWKNQLTEFYEIFHPLVVSSLEVDKSEVNPSREVGVDPADGQKIYARYGRFGAMLQKGEADSDNKKFASLPNKATIETVTLEQALAMFQFPKQIGADKNGDPVFVKQGPYGPYIEAGKKRVSIKDLDPLTVTLEDANRLLKEKEQADANKIIRQFDNSDLKVLRSRFNTPYLSDGQQLSKFPKESDPETISLEEATEFFEKNKSKPNRRRKK